MIEGLAWLVYFVPVSLFVLRSSRRKPAPPKTIQTAPAVA